MHKKTSVIHTTRDYICLVFSILAMLSVIGCVAGSGSSQDTVDASNIGPNVITEDMTCPVCGMFPAKYPKWAPQIVFKDGSWVAFDGSKEMFKFLFNIAKYDPSHSNDQIVARWVIDFNTGDWLKAEKAVYVVGSDEKGPMGKEIISFADHVQATAFQEKHGGSIVVFHNITNETLTPLYGMKKMMKSGNSKMKPKKTMMGHGQM